MNYSPPDSDSLRAKYALRARDFASAENYLLRALDDLASHDKTEPLGPPPCNPQNSIGKNLYIPVEMAGRELASRAWIAGQCSKRGFNVVIGATWNMSYSQWIDWPPGIVLFKTLYALDARQFYTAKSYGHRVAVLDEEMMPLALTKRIYEFSLEPYALHLADLVCAPGEASAKILREMAPGKIAVTGNPRARKDTRPHIGGNILVCTSAPTINPAAGFDLSMRMTLRVAGKPLKDEVLDIWRGQVRHEIRWAALMLEAIDALKAKYGDRVIVRTHPAEDPSTFGFKADPGPLANRLNDADCVVFVSSCGVGIESAMAWVPAVRVGTGGDGVSSTFGTPAETVEEILAQVEGCLAGSQPIPDLTGIIQKEITLPQELESLWQKHAGDHDADLLSGFYKRRRQFQPGEFEMNKFPETTAEQISDMAGVPAVKIGWNLFAIMPA